MNRFHARSALTLALVASISALTACAGEDRDDSSRAPAATQPSSLGGDESVSDDQPSSAPADQTETTQAGASSPESPGEGTLEPAPTERQLIVEVTVGVEVPDVSAAVRDLIAIGDRHQAQVYGSDVQLSDPTRSSGTIVFKLPPDQVEPMIAEANALGRQITRYQTTDDVTDRVTDLATRIGTARQSVERMQAMLGEATDLGEVVLLEGELTARQTLLEELLAEQRNLGNRTALATLTIDLSTAPVEATDTPVADDGDDEGGIGSAFADGGRAFLTAVGAVLIFIGYTAPFIALGLVLMVVAWIVIRRRARRNRSAAPLPPPARDEDRQTTEPDSVGAARS
ncbi:MAG: DUF4349 domain-containing protein [Ilumatobacteraceae bacterium]